jgi:hypothetical protein
LFASGVWIVLTGIKDGADEKPVYAPVVGEFGMKSRGEEVSLAHEDREVFAPGEHFYPRTNLRKAGRADEYHFQRAARKPGGLGEDGGVDLAPVGVAFDDRIKQTERTLGRVQNFTGEEDSPGAGAKHGSGCRELFERLEESAALKELEHGGGFAPREDESVKAFELFGVADFGGIGACFDERFSMSGVVALDGEDTDARPPRFSLQSRFLCVHYQPRVCSSCDSSRAAAARPFIVPVTCSLTSARILGSL